MFEILNSDTENITLQRKRILYLTKDPELIKKQLSGEDLDISDESDLLDRVSTDAYPTRACFRFDTDFMASKALTGLSLGPNQWIPDNAIRNGGFGVIVAGSSFGCGSSREHFPWSLKAAGIELVVTNSVERIFGQNSQNIGLLYSEGNPLDIVNQLHQQQLTISALTKGKDRISAQIIRDGGLFSFFKKHGSDLSALPKPNTSIRPMTGPEKIIAQHMEVSFVQPGDIGFIQADRRYSYEIFFPFSHHILEEELHNIDIKDPSSVYLFYDHSVLDDSPDAQFLAEMMRKHAKEQNLTHYDGDKENGAEGICHTIMLDKHTLPGEVVLGTDSHTCTLGAIGALPIGIGATEWAAALWTNKIRLSVPHSIRFNLTGMPLEGVMAKDIMLHLLSLPYIKEGKAIGKIFIFNGETFNYLPFDEQVVFSNMSVEGGAFTGYIDPNKISIEFIAQKHGISQRKLSKLLHYSDTNANYEQEFLIDTSKLEPYIALPGDPRNGLPLSRVLENDSIETTINKAFIGSCTGSKYLDIKAAAAILEGQKVHPNVQLFVSPASREVYGRAYKDGLIKIIEESGGKILPSGCGACVNFGPGTVNKGERGISSTNRNFPGRMGAGEMFLANPAVVAASAIAGKISSARTLK